MYVFGNPDVERDSLAIGVAKRLAAPLRSTEVDSRTSRGAKIDEEILSILAKHWGGKTIEWEFVKPNEDLPFVGEEEVVILDVIEGINKVTVLTEKDLDKLVLPPRSSAHEYDLGFQLCYLKKLGKIKRVRIIGLPIEENKASR